jgi:hypothetical protein
MQPRFERILPSQNPFPSTRKGDSLNQLTDSGTAAVDIVEILKDDYSRFPKNQTYSLYAEDVYFKDPMNQF